MAEQKTTQIEVYQDRGNTLAQQALQVIIAGEEDLSKTSDWVKQAKEWRVAVEAERDEFTKPAKEIIATAKSKYDPVIDMLKGIEKTLKDKATAYILKRNAETAAKEKELADRAAAGEIQEKTAIRRMAALPEQKTTTQGAKSELRVSMIDDIEITDESLIPREYLMPNLVRIKAVVIKARMEVPGVKLVQKPKTSSY